MSKKLYVFASVLIVLSFVLTVSVMAELKPGDPLPRTETLYFNGQQWGPVVCWNPYSSSCNNAMAVNQQDSARVVMFETPYLYNMLDGKQYPLLADGDYVWNDAHTEITFKLKKAAKWSDGTPVTAEDVAYTWAAHVEYNTPTGSGNKDYIETIQAKDPQTVVIKAKLGADGKAVCLITNALHELERGRALWQNDGIDLSGEKENLFFLGNAHRGHM